MARRFDEALRPVRSAVHTPVPPVVRDGYADCPRCGLHFEREAATGPGRWRSTSYFVGGGFTILFVIAIAPRSPTFLSFFLAVFVPYMLL